MLGSYFFVKLGNYNYFLFLLLLFLLQQELKKWQSLSVPFEGSCFKLSFFIKLSTNHLDDFRLGLSVLCYS